MKWFAAEAKKNRIGGRPVWVCRPETETDRAMVFYHGWSSSAEKNLFRAMTLAAGGYLVLVPDAVHHGERGELDYDDRENVARHMFSVIDRSADEFSDLSAWLRDEGIRKILVCGHSMGGFTAAAVFARYPAADACVNLNGSFAFHEAAEGMLAKADPDERETLRAALVPYRSDPQDSEAALQNRPILMISGGADAVIDPEWQAAFYDRLRLRYDDQQRIRRMVVPYQGHFVTTNMLEETLAFAAEYLEEKA